MGTMRGQQVHQLRQIAHLHVTPSSRSQDKRVAIMEGLDEMTSTTAEMDSQDAVIIPFPDNRSILQIDGPDDEEMALLAAELGDPDDEDYYDSLMDDGPYDDETYYGFGTGSEYDDE